MRTKLVTINEFAKLCRTTPKTLRFYEKKGLFTPTTVDEWTHYRYYNTSQARDFLRLKLLQRFDLTLKQISKLPDEHTIEKTLDTKLEDIHLSIEEQKKEYTFLLEMKQFLFNKDNLKEKLRKETIGPLFLFCRKYPHLTYEKTREAALEVYSMALQLGLPLTHEYLMFYATRHFTPHGQPIEYGVVCREKVNVPLPKEYYYKEYQKTEVISYMYKGPFVYFVLLYKKLNDYIDKNKLSKTKSSFDYYIKYQENSKSEYDYLTKICFPIE